MTSNFANTMFGPVPADQLNPWRLVETYMEPLAEPYGDPSVTEIMVDRYDAIRIERAGSLHHVDHRFENDAQVMRLIGQISNRLGQPFDGDHPILDARFPDGARLCCTHPVVTPGGSTITIRLKRDAMPSLDALVSGRSLTEEMAEYLVAQVEGAATMLVSGGTSSGKTTILRALAKFIPAEDRVITVEDTLELWLSAFRQGVLAMEAPKRRDKDSREEITLSRLIFTALRQRPDRVWVGEIRNAAAAAAFLEMANTGHSGGASTLHSNSEAAAIRRMQNLLAMGGLLSYEQAGKELLNILELIIQAKRHPVHGRKIFGISRVEEGELIPVFRFNVHTGEHERVGDK